MKKRIIVAITGASGTEIGIKVLEELKKNGFETHAIVSEGAKEVMRHESERTIDGIRKIADFLYREKDMAATIASGSFKTEGMVVAPCSMKTLSAIANGYSDNLISRAADVCIKQKRTIVLSPRETPFSAIHLENMLKLARLGAWIIPPVMAFYNKPEKKDDFVGFAAGKILEALDIEHNLYKEWGNKNEL